jgi:hypothetical protein
VDVVAQEGEVPTEQGRRRVAGREAGQDHHRASVAARRPGQRRGAQEEAWELEEACDLAPCGATVGGADRSPRFRRRPQPSHREVGSRSRVATARPGSSAPSWAQARPVQFTRARPSVSTVKRSARTRAIEERRPEITSPSLSPRGPGARPRLRDGRHPHSLTSVDPGDI